MAKGVDSRIALIERLRPLCPDCRDKCKGYTCLRCEIQSLEKQLSETRKSLIEAIEHAREGWRAYAEERDACAVAVRKWTALEANQKKGGA